MLAATDSELDDDAYVSKIGKVVIDDTLSKGGISTGGNRKNKFNDIPKS